jgi:hypothetical protein
MTATKQPAGFAASGLLARHRVEIARFGTDVSAAGGIDPALAAGLDAAAYSMVLGGVPQAWEKARVYRELYAHYRDLYWTQVARLNGLLEPAPARDDQLTTD